MKKTKFITAICAATLLFALSVSSQQSTNMKAVDMSISDDKNQNTIFPKGEKVPAQNFTGTVWVKMLAARTQNNNFSIGSVTFEPGARSNWHTHPAGQTLLVISGTGLYQEKGQPVKTIKKGETIICDAEIEHWHGASPENGMTHVAITNFKNDSSVVWLKPVTDEEYKKGLK